jgi:hypothetical protein
MRKPTKLGYCTTCNTKIWIFDVNGIPFKRRDNYCEVLVDLSDGSRGRLAFCKGCVARGFDAEEAIQNAVEGVHIDIGKKNWNQDFKDWHLAFYQDLKIMGVHRAIKLKERGLTPVLDDKFEQLDEVGEVTNFFTGEITPREWSKPPLPYEGMENIKEFLNGDPNGNSSQTPDPV